MSAAAVDKIVPLSGELESGVPTTATLQVRDASATHAPIGDATVTVAPIYDDDKLIGRRWTASLAEPSDEASDALREEVEGCSAIAGWHTVVGFRSWGRGRTYHDSHVARDRQVWVVRAADSVRLEITAIDYHYDATEPPPVVLIQLCISRDGNVNVVLGSPTGDAYHDDQRLFAIRRTLRRSPYLVDAAVLGQGCTYLYLRAFRWPH